MSSLVYTEIMSNPLYGTAPQDYLQAISGITAPTQVILNRQGGFSDYQYPEQVVVNLKAGRTANALTFQQALAKNTGYTGTGPTADILKFAYTQGLTMSKIVTGS